MDRGICVILTPGRYNSAFFEHSYLARRQVQRWLFGWLVCGGWRGLLCGFVSWKAAGWFHFIAEYPMNLLIRWHLSHLPIGGTKLDAGLCKGNVALSMRWGTVLRWQGNYILFPKWLEYYLKKSPILQNAPHICLYKEDYDYILANMESLSSRMWVRREVTVWFSVVIWQGKVEWAENTHCGAAPPLDSQEVIRLQGYGNLDGNVRVERKAICALL
jgi:hypothetical protein